MDDRASSIQRVPRLRLASFADGREVETRALDLNFGAMTVDDAFRNLPELAWWLRMLRIYEDYAYAMAKEAHATEAKARVTITVRAERG